MSRVNRQRERVEHRLALISKELYDKLCRIAADFWQPERRSFLRRKYYALVMIVLST